MAKVLTIDSITVDSLSEDVATVSAQLRLRVGEDENLYSPSVEISLVVLGVYRTAPQLANQISLGFRNWLESAHSIPNSGYDAVYVFGPTSLA